MTTQNLQKVIISVNTGLIIAIALAGLLVARDTVMLMGSSVDSSIPEVSKKKSSAQKALTSGLTGLMRYAPVVKNNIFGFDAGELSPIMALPEATGGTQEDAVFSVLGTVAWSKGFGYAFIKDPEGKQTVIKTGEEMPGSGILDKVYTDWIVVNTGGRLNKIDVVELAASKVSPGSPAPNRKSRKPKIVSGFAKRTGSDSFVVDRSAVQESISDPKRLMTDARMLPHRGPSGKQEGFKVFEVVKGGIYDNLGVSNGDVVVSVNGLKLATPESALQVFTSVKGASRISVDIIRGGEKKTLTYTLR